MWHGLFYLHFCIVVNFYSHIPCGMWRKAALELYYDKTISTHTSRVGCDTVEQWHQYITGGISTHTSRVGCDYFSNHPSDRFFLYFYSHIPCGMWLVRPNFKPIIIPISTHTSRVGCDLYLVQNMQLLDISTHTSRVGCDTFLPHCPLRPENFYSHIPCGMWPYSLQPSSTSIFNFYSHIPCGMWLMYTVAYLLIFDFYSHIPCGMWPIWYNLYTCSGCYFYSHIPCGMWRQLGEMSGIGRNFYSHIPCGMWQYVCACVCGKSSISTHTSRVGCDIMAISLRSSTRSFLLTHPVWDVTAIYSIFQSHYSHILQDGPIIHLELY